MGKSQKVDDAGRLITKQETKTVIKTTYECEKCQHQCRKGIEYIDNVKSGRVGKGVACVIKVVKSDIESNKESTKL